jgi:acyl-coenzyme A thioesterase PaaI-like protein
MDRDAPRDELVSALRDVQDLIVQRDPPEEVLHASTELLRGVAHDLRRFPATEWSQGAGAWDAGTRQAGPLVPPFVIDRSADDALVGRATFTPFFHGGGGAAHGGAIPLLFDHVLGRLCNAPGRTRSRTAYLHVNYRRIAPIGRELGLDATLDREEGRKLFATARLLDGDDLVADAEGLYLALRPGQP